MPCWKQQHPHPLMKYNLNLKNSKVQIFCKILAKKVLWKSLILLMNLMFTCKVFFQKISIHTPPPPYRRDWKFGGGVIVFFLWPASIFIQLCIKFCCLHFASRVVNRKEINPANLKHKMNIFVLVGLDILLLLESDHFTEKRLVSRWSACCGK